VGERTLASKFLDPGVPFRLVLGVPAINPVLEVLVVHVPSLIADPVGRGQVPAAGGQLGSQPTWACSIPVSRFSGAEFSGGQVSFGGAEFSGGTVYFRRARFSGGTVYFRLARFPGGEVYFRRAEFSGGEVSFRGAEFSGGTVDFGAARFSGGEVSFGGGKFSGGDEVASASPGSPAAPSTSAGLLTGQSRPGSPGGTRPPGVKLPQKQGQSPV
jgi:Pentapeptide repeats (9 copies)